MGRPWSFDQARFEPLRFEGVGAFFATKRWFSTSWSRSKALTTPTTFCSWVTTTRWILRLRITRAAVLKLAAEAQMKIVERPFTIAEAQDAAEAFITAASTFVCPVVEIDGVTLGDGKPGPVTRRLREIYIATARAAAT